MPISRTLLLALLAGVLLTSCTGAAPWDAKESRNRSAELAKIPPDDQQIRAREGVPITTLQLSPNVLRDRRLVPGDPLPSDIKITNTNLNAVPVAAALQAVLAGTKIALSWETGQLEDRYVTIYNLSGSLADVVDRICQAAKVSCAYRDGAIQITEKDTYLIEMPPLPSGTTNTIADTIKTLSAGEVINDTDSGSLIYTTDAAGNHKVRQYLEQIRRGRPLVVLQVYLWEVTLSKDNQTGIRWDSPKLSGLQTGSNNIDLLGFSSGISGVPTNPLVNSAATQTALRSASLQNAISFGAIFTGALDAAALLSFLAEQGSVETISSPQLTFVSGAESEFSVGGKIKYISQVGQLTTTTTSGTGSTGTSNNLGNNTVQTEELETGLKVKVDGSYDNGIFFGNLEIKETILIEFDEVPTGGTVIQLPRTQDRELKTTLRVRPGDSLVLAGLKSSRDQATRRGLPTGGSPIPTFALNQKENRELVILLQPSIVKFSDEPQLSAAGSSNLKLPGIEQKSSKAVSSGTLQRAFQGAVQDAERSR